MTAVINGIVVTGTPEEMSELITLFIVNKSFTPFAKRPSGYTNGDRIRV